MAVTVTAILAGVNTYIADVVATADGDTTATVTHGLVTTPKEVNGLQLISQALTALSAWAATAIGATTITLTKLASTGSGNASAQFRCTAKTPHSIGA